MGVALWLPRRSGPEREGSAQQLPRASTVPVEPPVRPIDTGAARPEASDASPDRSPRGVVKDDHGLLVAADPAAMDWGTLQDAVSNCRGCALCETRTQTVFGVGNRDADLLVIGEAPGADEDREGEPFVGRAGQLLNRMLAAIGLPRGQVYIANILKCRPPGNRDPRPEESLRCQPFLMRQIALIRPRVVLTVGRISAQTLLGTDVPVGRLRARWFELGPEGIPLRVTYHPAYLLRSPDQKAKVWEDLTAVVRRLGGEGTGG